jgi:hypothetical protein
MSYQVFRIDHEFNPGVLAERINGLCENLNLEFISADDGYYIFKELKDE